MAAVLTSNGEVLSSVLTDLFALLQIPSPWPATPPVVAEFIEDDAGVTTDLNGIAVGEPEAFAHEDLHRLPMLLIDPNISFVMDKSEYGSVKTPAHIFTIPLYYIMSSEPVADVDRGVLGSIPELLVVNRAGRIRACLENDTNWKNLGGTTVFMSETSHPTIVNDLNRYFAAEQRKYVAARLDVIVGVCEELSSL